MRVKKIKLITIKDKDLDLDRKKIPIHERISHFQIPIESTNHPKFRIIDYDNYIFNLRRVRKWYFYKYGDVENTMKIPLSLNNKFNSKEKLYFITSIETNFMGKQYSTVIDNKTIKPIIPKNNTMCFNLYKNILDSGINKVHLPLNSEDEKRIIRHNEGIVWYKNNLAKVDRNKNNLFLLSYYDYQSSVNNLIMHNFGNSIWSSQQACEKLLKGVLTEKNISYDDKGSVGHNLNRLLTIFKNNNFELDLSSNFTSSSLSNLNADLRYKLHLDKSQAYKYCLLYLDLLAEMKSKDIMNNIENEKVEDNNQENSTRIIRDYSVVRKTIKFEIYVKKDISEE